MRRAPPEASFAPDPCQPREVQVRQGTDRPGQDRTQIENGLPQVHPLDEGVKDLAIQVEFEKITGKRPCIVIGDGVISGAAPPRRRRVPSTQVCTFESAWCCAARRGCPRLF